MSRKISEQVKISSCNVSKQISYKLTSGSKSVCSVLHKLVLYSFLIFLEKSTRVSWFLTGLVFVSYKPVSYKKTCNENSMQGLQYGVTMWRSDLKVIRNIKK